MMTTFPAENLTLFRADPQDEKVPQLIQYVGSPLLQQCPKNGFFTDQTNKSCDTFYSCSCIGTRFAQGFLFKCPAGCEFDQRIHRCIHPSMPAVRKHQSSGQCTHRAHTTFVVKDYMEEKKNTLADLIQVFQKFCVTFSY